MGKYFYLLFLLVLPMAELKAQTEKNTLEFVIENEKGEPLFGVYVVRKANSQLLTASDMDGKCRIHTSSLSLNDSILFQGLEYATRVVCLRELQSMAVIRLQTLHYELDEVVAHGVPTAEILRNASEKLRKQKGKRLPLCYLYGPAQYEKITWCRDSAVEYRREYGHYFTSGDIIPKNSWDETYRSYIVPEYTARTYNMTPDSQDTLTPVFLTTEEIRLDVGTRKIFTLIRAVQLYGPLFSDNSCYDFRATETEQPNEYAYRFNTKPQAYPHQTRISCRGTLTIDADRRELKSMTFDYIDYQLLRQILLTNSRNTSSPFSTQAELTFGYDTSGGYHITSCRQKTTWKNNLGEDFILIEQPSRHNPGPNKLIEEEAFRCYRLDSIPAERQTTQILSKIHLAQRYPQGIYDSAVFNRLPLLLDNRRAIADLNRYQPIESQFRRFSGVIYYPENYILESHSDRNSRELYLTNLKRTRQQLNDIWGPVPREPVKPEK